jgi:hypothetical protein
VHSPSSRADSSSSEDIAHLEIGYPAIQPPFRYEAINHKICKKFHAAG